MPANRNILFVIIGGLLVATAVLGYQLYQDRKKPEGVQINLGPAGISIDKK
jgi:predicted negative regulator of RcsB-dependent stress response